jgi:Arc/MetJ family transcription regulator
MRTNIILDEDLINRARQLTGIKTKKQVIQEALRLLIQIREQENVRALRGKLRWEGNLDELRQGRQL